MSRGGAARQRAGDAAPATGAAGSRRPAERSGPTRRTNWVVVVLITLVMVGLVGGYFVAFAKGGTSGTDTTTSTTRRPLRRDARPGRGEPLPKQGFWVRSGGEARTHDPLINSQLLCQLSYPGRR